MSASSRRNRRNQSKQIPELIVNGSGRHEQDASPDHELRERPIAVRAVIADAVGFVDDEQADARLGRQATRPRARRFVSPRLGLQS